MASNAEECQRIRMDLARALARARREAGYKQYVFADEIGFSQTTIGRAEHGRPDVGAKFWEACDRRLGTTLARDYGKISALNYAAKQERTRTVDDEPQPCGFGCAECQTGPRLDILARRLVNRGVQVTIVSKGGHGVGINATNPDAAERGTFYVEYDGCIMWERPEGLDDDGIDRTVDEAINCLRVNGIALPRRIPSGAQ